MTTKHRSQWDALQRASLVPLSLLCLAVCPSMAAWERSWMQAGLDSLGAVELRNAITARFAVDVPATLAFDYPTQAAILGFVVGQLGAHHAADVRSTPPLAALQLQLPGSREWTELIAIGCKYPGAAEGDSHCHPVYC